VTSAPRTRSVSKRFTSAFIAVVTVLLVGFAAVVIVVNVRKVDADLKELLDDVARLAQVSLPVPVWNLDGDAVTSFSEALLLRDALVSVEVFSEGQSSLPGTGRAWAVCASRTSPNRPRTSRSPPTSSTRARRSVECNWLFRAGACGRRSSGMPPGSSP
jgi:hypothetical protein